MMISPDTYAMMCKDKSYKELIRERDTLIREIRKLEKIVLKHDIQSLSPLYFKYPLIYSGNGI